MKQKETVPIPQKLLLTIEEAAIYSNIGITKIYEMTNKPMCNFVIYIGKKRLIKRKRFEEFIEKNIEI